MSYFSAAFTQVMESRGLKQAHVARAAGLDQGQLSRYLNADSRPDVTALAKLLSALDEDARPLVLIGYLRDDIPAEYRNLVTITAGGESNNIQESPEPSAFDRLPSKPRKLLCEIADEFERSPELVTALQATMDLIRPR